MSKEIMVRTFVANTSEYWKNRYPDFHKADIFYIKSFRSVFSYADDQIIHWFGKPDSVTVYHLITYPVVTDGFKNLDPVQQDAILERVDAVLTYIPNCESWMNMNHNDYNYLLDISEKQGALSSRVRTRQDAHAFVELCRTGDPEFLFLDNPLFLNE